MTNKKFMNAIVKAFIISHVPGPHIERSGCGLDKWCATSSLISRCLRLCASTSNRSCLTPYDMKSSITKTSDPLLVDTCSEEIYILLVYKV